MIWNIAPHCLQEGGGRFTTTIGKKRLVVTSWDNKHRRTTSGSPGTIDRSHNVTTKRFFPSVAMYPPHLFGSLDFAFQTCLTRQVIVRGRYRFNPDIWSTVFYCKFSLCAKSSVVEDQVPLILGQIFTSCSPSLSTWNTSSLIVSTGGSNTVFSTLFMVYVAPDLSVVVLCFCSVHPGLSAIRHMQTPRYRWPLFRAFMTYMFLLHVVK